MILSEGYRSINENMANIIEITDFEAPELDVIRRFSYCGSMNRNRGFLSQKVQR